MVMANMRLIFQLDDFWDGGEQVAGVGHTAQLAGEMACDKARTTFRVPWHSHLPWALSRRHIANVADHRPPP